MKTWLTNSTESTASFRARELANNLEKDIEIGPPKASQVYSAEELEKRGMVGLYLK